MYDIDFLPREEFKKVVKQTMLKYHETFKPFNLEMFNKSLVDPVKLLFDNKLSSETWEETIKKEITRQRDKSNNNEIGTFHQQLFAHIKNCVVPSEGWDVIYTPENREERTIFVELKNKHNTMNSSSSQKTYMRMQGQILNNDNCECYLVEVIAKKSQDIVWETTLDNRKVAHKLIRRVSIDKFYHLITGQENAFYKICVNLPILIDELIGEGTLSPTGEDSVFLELQSLDSDYLKSIYKLAFATYEGFEVL
jgi:hypothetical protein